MIMEDIHHNKPTDSIVIIDNDYVAEEVSSTKTTSLSPETGGGHAANPPKQTNNLTTLTSQGSTKTSISTDLSQKKSGTKVGRGIKYATSKKCLLLRKSKHKTHPPSGKKQFRRSRCSEKEKHLCPVCSLPDCGKCIYCM